MKRLFFLAAAFVTGVTAFAQQKADEVIKVSAEQYNFGKIKQGVPVTTYFTITNISDKPVVIENAWGSCGCTTPEWDKQPIPPNGTTKIKVGYNAAAAMAFTKDVNVKLAGIQEPKVLKISGEVMEAGAYDVYAKSDDFKKDQKLKSDKEMKDTKAAKKASKKAKNNISAGTK